MINFKEFKVLGIALFHILLLVIPKQLMYLYSDNFQEAAKSLAFYRQSNRTSNEVLAELTNIRRSLNADLEGNVILLTVNHQVIIIKNKHLKHGLILQMVN